MPYRHGNRPCGVLGRYIYGNVTYQALTGGDLLIFESFQFVHGVLIFGIDL